MSEMYSSFCHQILICFQIMYSRVRVAKPGRTLILRKIAAPRSSCHFILVSNGLILKVKLPASGT